MGVRVGSGTWVGAALAFALYGATALYLIASGSGSLLGLGVPVVAVVAVSVGLCGAVVWQVVYVYCGFGTRRARGALAGLLTGLAAPTAALLGVGVVLWLPAGAEGAPVLTAFYASGPPEPSVRAGVAALPLVGWVTIPYGIGVGLVLAEFDRGESDPDG